MSLLPETSPTLEDRNKRVVIDFFRHVLEARNPAAAKDFVTDDYKQHCRHIPGGKDGLERYLRQIFGDAPPLPVKDEMTQPPVLLVAQNDVVVIAGYAPQPEPEAPNTLYDYFVFDAFRLRDGKLAEHWNSINKIAPPRHP
ncbi:nuclear transport factor 2 family protein [Paraburkholderia sp. J67]|uniref:nuclear transport factor 2 family protein n=1 Tax=Paraburkholderia sp. J67 TaxID=2805435 RepID=UPI002ABD3A8E|nr:nuclear transport factor 2 family protein [Paraburkholderia sp. J67]